MTTRNLYTRVAEHCGQSFRTGRALTQPPHSAVRDHVNSNCKTTLSDQNFKILASSPHANDLKILESLYIFKLRPSLNNMNSSYPLQLVNR